MEDLKFNTEFGNPFSHKGVNMYPNPFMTKGKGIQTKQGIVLHPYDIAKMLLIMGESYSFIFTKIGLNDSSIDACIDFAKDKLNQFINRS